MSKHGKKDKANKERQERAKQAEYAEVIKQPRPRSWSSGMPAYAGTVLCSDKQYRPKKKEST